MRPTCAAGWHVIHFNGHVRQIVARETSCGAAGCSITNMVPRKRHNKQIFKVTYMRALAVASCVSSGFFRPSRPHGEAAVRNILGPPGSPSSCLPLARLQVSQGGAAKTAATSPLLIMLQSQSHLALSSISCWAESARSTRRTLVWRPKAAPSCSAYDIKSPDLLRPEKRYTMTVVCLCRAASVHGHCTRILWSLDCCSDSLRVTSYGALKAWSHSVAGFRGPVEPTVWGMRMSANNCQSTLPTKERQANTAEPSGDGATEEIQDTSAESKRRASVIRDSGDSVLNWESKRASKQRKESEEQGWLDNVESNKAGSSTQSDCQTSWVQARRVEESKSNPRGRLSVRKDRQSGGLSGPWQRSGGKRNLLWRSCCLYVLRSWAKAASIVCTSAKVKGWTVWTKAIRHPVCICLRCWITHSLLS